MATALITGASSGIGRELAIYHAARGGDLVVTARRQDALQTLKADLETRYGITVTVIALDLGAPGAARTLHAEVAKTGQQIDILINNAGFGGHGLHIERDIDQEMAMIDLNIKALVELSWLFGRDMAGRGAGRILQVGSTAGMMPGPLQAVYFGTKAFVGSFSQALDEELRPRGVTCTTLAPGFVNTEFAQRANLTGIRAAKMRPAAARNVAKCGYDAMMAGKLHVINDRLLSFLLNWIMPFMPRRWMLKAMYRAQSRP